MTFQVGDSGTIDPGIEWRIVQGKKSADDQRLDFRIQRFTPISMKLHMIAGDFYAQNERRLQDAGVIGARKCVSPGDRFLSFIEGAMFMGWQTAADQLDMERDMARIRRTG